MEEAIPETLSTVDLSEKRNFVKQRVPRIIGRKLTINNYLTKLLARVESTNSEVEVELDDQGSLIFTGEQRKERGLRVVHELGAEYYATDIIFDKKEPGCLWIKRSNTPKEISRRNPLDTKLSAKRVEISKMGETDLDLVLDALDELDQKFASHCLNVVWMHSNHLQRLITTTIPESGGYYADTSNQFQEKVIAYPFARFVSEIINTEEMPDVEKGKLIVAAVESAFDLSQKIARETEPRTTKGISIVEPVWSLSPITEAGTLLKQGVDENARYDGPSVPILYRSIVGMLGAFFLVSLARGKMGIVGQPGDIPVIVIPAAIGAALITNAIGIYMNRSRLEDIRGWISKMPQAKYYSGLGNG